MKLADEAKGGGEGLHIAAQATYLQLEIKGKRLRKKICVSHNTH